MILVKGLHKVYDLEYHRIDIKPNRALGELIKSSCP